MSGSFLRQLGLDAVDHVLSSGSGSHAAQTAKIMLEFERVCQKERPDWVVVVGDVNSTLACSVVAKKLGIKVCHVEAGLRSFNRAMPEEINRLVTDAISDLYLTTSEDAERQLLKENVAGSKIHFVGNLMIDSLYHHLAELPRAEAFDTDQRRLPTGGFCALTLHRPSNVDAPERLKAILRTLRTAAAGMPIFFPCHPRTRANLEAFGLANLLGDRDFILSGPVDYFKMLRIYQHARFIVTDSGGVQEETTALGIPCLTVREETERPVTVAVGTNTLIGNDLAGLAQCIDAIRSGSYKPGQIPKYWDGHAAERAWSALLGVSPDDLFEVDHVAARVNHAGEAFYLA